MQRVPNPLSWLTLSIFTAILLSAAAVLLLPGHASAAPCPPTVTVTDAGDSGASTLRQAITDVCADGTIDFDPSLTSSGPVTITLTSGELAVTKNMTIDGPGANLLAVSGNNAARVFNVSSSAKATIDGLTIRDGAGPANWYHGAGILNAGTLTVTNSAINNNTTPGYGGGIQNTGASAVLTVTDSLFYGNSAGSKGGGLSNFNGKATVQNCAFVSNSATSGGGAFTQGSQLLTVVNSTFSGNLATDGGGVNNSYGNLVLTNSTLTDNSGGGGGNLYVVVSSGSATLANTIIGSSSGIGSCYANSLIDAGGNIDAGSGCGFSAANGSQPNTNPLLAPLQLISSTYVLPLLPGSPAIDFGVAADCPATDQRGVIRPQGSACDSGAFESQGFTLTVTGGSWQTATIYSPFAQPLTVTVSSVDGSPTGPGGIVTFTPPSSGAGLTVTDPFTANTNAAGVASSGVITANAVTGSYDVTANVRGESISITGFNGGPTAAVFDLTNRCNDTDTVTNTDDDGSGSLRRAMLTLCRGGVIDFDPALTASGPNTITLTSGELVIDKDMTITGLGANLLSVSGSNASRVFNVSYGVNATLNKLTIRDGNTGSDGGGGIYSFGALTVTESALVNNNAGGTGGGITSLYSSLTVTNSTFSGNTASSYGGGIYVLYGTLAAVNSTFTANSANGGGGGGIAAASSTALVTNTTFAANSAFGGSGVHVLNGGMTLVNSVLAYSAALDNCSLGFNGTITDGGGNIEDGSTCGFSPANGSLSSTDPLLGGLFYSNDTFVLPLLPGSPAIDAGVLNGCPQYDQRGAYRPQGDGCDSGAFETQGFVLSLAGGSPQTTTVFSAFTAPLTVSVTSGYDDPVGPGGVITFTPPSEGPGLNVTAPFTAGTDANGVAAPSVTANAVAGSYNVTATVRGEVTISTACGGNPCDGEPAVFDLTNERIEPDINLSSSANPSVFTEMVALSVDIAADVPGASTPTGVITFTVNGDVLDIETLDAWGEATFYISSLPVGSYEITAEYSGDDSYTSGQSNVVTQVVNKAPTETQLDSKPSYHVFYGDKVTFAVTVAPNIQQPTALVRRSGPSGAVTITDTTGVIDLVGWAVDGEVEISGGIIPAGTYEVVAAFAGNESYESSALQPQTLVVDKFATTTSLGSSGNPVYVGDPLSFTALVSELQIDGLGAASLPPPAPTGAVVIADTTGAINLGGSLLNGVVQLPAPWLPAGVYTVTATYQGNERYASSVSTQVIQVVERQPTWTGLELAPDLARIGDTILLTATVGVVNPTALGSGGPSGTVQFLADGALLGNALLNNSQALLSVPASRAGAFAVTAHYLGNERYADSTADAVQLAVDKYDTNTTLTAAPNPSNVGETVIFKATVAGASERYAPTGAITFSADGVMLGTVPLGANGNASLATNSLSAGSHTITAQYEGDGFFVGSTSADYQQVVQIMLRAVNDAAGAQGQPVSINVTANDWDPAGGGLTVVSVTAPGHGSATVEPNSRNVIYTPAAGYSGIDTFTYVIQDIQGKQDDALVVVVVTTPADGQEKPQIQTTNPMTDSTAAFTGRGFTADVLAPAGFFTDTLAPKDVLFISFTPVITPTEGTNHPPANLKFGNAEFVLEVYLNDQLLTGQTFAVPLEVVINYDPALLGSLKPETLGLWYWDGAAWSTDGVTIINNDVANHTLTVSMTHFSFYAFFAAAPTGLDPGDEPEAPFRLYLPNVNK